MVDKRVRQTRIYEKVVDEIKALIASGSLRQGEPVPPERQLMEDLGVSRSSLREAFRVLELLGLIESIPGKGRFVRRGRGEEGGASDPRKLEDGAILELMEARRVLDPAIAARQPARPSPGISPASGRSHHRREWPSPRPGPRRISISTWCSPRRPRTVFVNIVKMTFNLIMATHDRIYCSDRTPSARTPGDLRGHPEPRRRGRPLLNRHIERIYRTLQEALALGGPKSMITRKRPQNGVLPGPDPERLSPESF